MGKLVISLFLLLAAAGPALAQATTTKPPAAAPAPSTSPPTATTPPSAPSPSAGAPSTRFSSESAAKEHCPGDTIVWVASSRSRYYHVSGERSFGRGRRGAYMCQKDAAGGGLHQYHRRGTTRSSATKPPSGGTNQ